MSQQPSAPPDIVPIAVAFETGLGVLALVVGWWLGYHPGQTIELRAAALPAHAAAAAWGVAATLPMLGLLLAVERGTFGELERLRTIVDEHLVPLFAAASLVEFALISLAAGVGEELLFRGLLQGIVADRVQAPLGTWLGLAVASIVFGVCHWLSRTYAVLACLIGLYLGGLFIATGNLLTPMVAHTLYDFAALVYLVKWRKEASDPEA